MHLLPPSLVLLVLVLALSPAVAGESVEVQPTRFTGRIVSAVEFRAPDSFDSEELRYLVDHEYARAAQDVLWRRSKLGLHLPDEAQQAVADWFAARD